MYPTSFYFVRRKRVWRPDEYTRSLGCMRKTAYTRVDTGLPGKMYAENSIHSAGTRFRGKMYAENSIQ